MDDFVDLEYAEAEFSPELQGSDDPIIQSCTFSLEPLHAIELDRSQQWLIFGLMPRRGLHVLYGAPGTGKSFVALNAALHVAAGIKWAGKEVHQAGVVYIAAEGGRSFRKRVVAAKSALNLPASTPFTLITAAPRIGGEKDQSAELIKDIRRQCARLKIDPRLIVLDTLSRSIRDLRESDASDIMCFVDQAETIAKAFGDALVMPVHHSGKDEARGMRGSSALHAAADAEWRTCKDDNGDRFIVVEKMKDGAAAGRLAYSLQSLELGKDERGDLISTCVVEVSAEAADRNQTSQDSEHSPTALTQALKTLFGLQMLLQLEGQISPARDAMPNGSKVLSITRVKQVLSAAGLLANEKKAAEVALERALKTLVERKQAGRDANFVWLLKSTAS